MGERRWTFRYGPVAGIKWASAEGAAQRAAPALTERPPMFGVQTMRVPRSIVILAVLELGLIFASFYAGIALSWVQLGRDIQHDLLSAFLYTLVTFGALFAMGMYSRENIRKYVENVIRLALGLVLAFAILTAIFYAFPSLAIWRSVIGFAMLVLAPAIPLLRLVAIRMIDLNRLKRRIAVIGVGEQAARIEGLAAAGRALSFTCIGYLDPGHEPRRIPDSRVLPQVNFLAAFLQDQRVDEVVVAIANRRSSLPSDALLQCRLAGIAVVDYMSFYASESGRVDLDWLQPSWFLFSDGFNGDRSYRSAKRLLDIVVSLVALAAFLPIGLIAAFVLWLESGRPILHRQVRIGRRGEPFTLLKFRSMWPDAEEDGVPRWAAQNDSRVTPVGRILRRTRIDELPQLINVLKGDMSFVGPRPERPYFVEQLSRQIAFYTSRHAIRPGLTGWAQLNYSYGASVEDARRKLEYDLYYMKYCGLLLDCLTILQTIRVIIWPNGFR